MQQQGDQCAGAGAGAVVGQQRVLELILADHVLGELHMQLVLRPGHIEFPQDMQHDERNGRCVWVCVWACVCLWLYVARTACAQTAKEIRIN